MPRRKGTDLTDRHLAILRAIHKLQPCGSNAVAKEASESMGFTWNTIYLTFSRRGLVESEVVRVKGCKPRRKYGTLRLTPEGERAINGNIRSMVNQ